MSRCVNSRARTRAERAWDRMLTGLAPVTRLAAEAAIAEALPLLAVGNVVTVDPGFTSIWVKADGVLVATIIEIETGDS